MSKLTIDIPKGESGKDLLPNYLRPSKASCHDKCKYGRRRESESGSSWPYAKEVSWIAKTPVDSIARRASQAKMPNQIKPRPWRIPGSSCSTDQQSRRFSESIDLKRYRHIEKDSLSISEWRIAGGVKSTGQGGKKAQTLPEVSRTVKSASYKSLKKQNTVAKGRSKKCIEEHVPRKILHVVEPKGESEGNKATQGAFKNEVIYETSDSDESPRKLKFGKGKIIDIQKAGTSTRGLKFSQQMSLLENENCNADDNTKKSLRETEPESRVNEPHKCIVIKLKHQTVEAKQGSPKTSYNSLIEDTTHSRVWVNRSKVKALVNAFETVISLNKSQVTSIQAIKET